MTVARWSWLGDRLALDAANTVRRRGWRYTELITSPADLRGWLARERDRLAVPAQVDTALVARFVLTRDHVLRVLRGDIRDPAARKLQFGNGRCVLDTYLYAPRARREPVVTYAEARASDGTAMNWNACAEQLRAH